MVEQFKRGCSFCSKQIIMIKQSSGGWKAYETTGTTLHVCRTPTYSEVPASEARNQQMAPPEVEKAMEEVKTWNKKQEEKERVLVTPENIDELLPPKPRPGIINDDPMQVLITELTKQTHLLKEINDNLIEIVKKQTYKFKEDEQK